MSKFTGQFELLKGYKLIKHKGWFEIFDEHGNVVYYEDIKGVTHAYLYDKNHVVCDYKSSSGLWFKQRTSDDGELEYFEDTFGILPIRKSKKSK